MVSVSKDVEKLEPLCIADGNVKWYNCCGKTCQFHRKIDIELPYDSAIPLLGIYHPHSQLKATTQTNKYMYKHIYSNIIHNSQGWKPLKCLS